MRLSDDMNGHSTKEKEFELRINSYGSFPVTRPSTVPPRSKEEETKGWLASLCSRLMRGSLQEGRVDGGDEPLLWQEQEQEPPTWRERCTRWLRVDGWTQGEKRVAGYVLSLMAFFTGERIFFKAAVDDMAPFRAVLLIFIFLVAFLLFAAVSICKRYFTADTNIEASNLVDFPHKSLLLMAVVDSISFGGLVLSATGVTPTKTVLLMHASTPCVVIGSKFVFTNRQYTSVQITGVVIICLALLMSLSDPLLSFIAKKSDQSDSFNSDQSHRACSAVVYTCAAALQGLASLFKEKAIIDYSLPTDIHSMSCWLFLYQFMFAVVLFPVFYLLQGLFSGWGEFPLSSSYENFVDGVHCFAGTDPDPLESSYHVVPTTCSAMKWLVLGYALCTVMVLLFIDKLIVADNQALSKTMSCAVLTAFLAALVYNALFANTIEDSHVGATDFLSLIVLLIGMETFARDPEPEPEMVTNFSPTLGRYE